MYCVQNLACKVEGSSPLLLTLTGACTALTPSKDVYTIVATVRTKEIKSLPVSNKSLVDWELKAIIEGAYFSGQDVLLVPAGATVNYDVTYYPLTMTMTPDSDTHLVSELFLVFAAALRHLTRSPVRLILTRKTCALTLFPFIGKEVQNSFNVDWATRRAFGL